MEPTNVYYRVEDKVITFGNGIGEDIILDYPNLCNAVDYIRTHPEEYATPESHQAHLDMYQGALSTLKAYLK